MGIYKDIAYIHQCSETQGLPELFGGSADLTGSNGTRWAEASEQQYMSYGVREFDMSAVTNGVLLHGGITVHCLIALFFGNP